MPPETSWRTDSTPAGGTKNDPADDLGVEIHHTATDDKAGPTGGADNAAELAALCRSIWNYHVKTKGWADIFYGFVVARDGTIAVGRGYHLGTSTGHRWVTIALAGNYDTLDATPEQLASVRHIRDLGRSIGVGDKVRGHGDRDNTACPGAGGRSIIAQLLDGGAQVPDPAPAPPSAPAPVPRPAPASVSVSWPILRQGSRGNLVTTAQAMLVYTYGQAGTVGAVDGIFGKKTTEGTERVQRFFGITADGIIGPETLGVLLTDWEAL